MQDGFVVPLLAGRSLHVRNPMGKLECGKRIEKEGEVGDRSSHQVEGS